MHELSIALSLIEVAAEEAARRGDAQIEAIHLKLGPLSGVVKEALVFSFDVACEGTPLQGCKLIIEDMPIVVYCPKCDARRSVRLEHWFACPECGTPGPDVVQGKELEIAALELSQLEVQT